MGTVFRDSIAAVSPPWLTRTVGGGILYAFGLAMDGLAQWATEGIQAAFPGVGTPDALGHIGNDRQIDRGPNESDDDYAARLSASFDTWRGAGNAFTILPELAAFFSPSTPTRVLLVSNNSVWHSLVSGVVTKTVGSANWLWDLIPGRWWRGWVVIDSVGGPWAPRVWGHAGDFWGDGQLWGLTATFDEVTRVQRIVQKWKPANVFVYGIVINFNASHFDPAHAAGGGVNPDGTWSIPANRFSDAAYLDGGA